MASEALDQFGDVLPPRAGQTLALTLDATARSYDLTALTMSEHTPEGSNHTRVDVFLCMQAEDADAYYSFSSAAKSINDATAVAAGGTLAFADAHCAVLPAGGAPVRLRLNRAADRFLNVKGSAAGTLRMWVASYAS